MRRPLQTNTRITHSVPVSRCPHFRLCYLIIHSGGLSDYFLSNIDTRSILSQKSVVSNAGWVDAMLASWVEKEVDGFLQHRFAVLSIACQVPISCMQILTHCFSK